MKRWRHASIVPRPFTFTAHELQVSAKRTCEPVHEPHGERRRFRSRSLRRRRPCRCSHLEVVVIREDDGQRPEAHSRSRAGTDPLHRPAAYADRRRRATTLASVYWGRRRLPPRASSRGRALSVVAREDPLGGGVGASGGVYCRDLRYSSKEGAAEMDWRGSDSFLNGSGSRVSNMPPLPAPSLFSPVLGGGGVELRACGGHAGEMRRGAGARARRSAAENGPCSARFASRAGEMRDAGGAPCRGPSWSGPGRPRPRWRRGRR